MRSAIVALTVLIAACGGSVHVVRARAAADLECDEYIEVRAMPGAAYHASGCGRTVSYVCGPRLCVREGEVRTEHTAGYEARTDATSAEAEAALRASPELLALAPRVRACSPVARTLELTIAEDGRVTGMNGNIATADEEECIARALAGVRVTSVSGPTQLRVRFSTDAPAHVADAPTPQAEPRPSLEPWLADIAARHRDTILACTGRPLVALRVVVANHTPQWSLQGDLAGTPEEECVRSLLASEPAPPADGTLVRVVR